MTRLEELRGALRDATEAADAEWRSDGPRLAVCQELSREEQRLRVEIVREGGCCGQTRQGPLATMCGCVAVRLHVAETLRERMSVVEANQWSDYCSQCDAYRLALQMREMESCSGLSVHNLMRVANESIK